MQRVKTASAVQDRPEYSDVGTPGYFRNGDAVAAIPATVPGAQWFNLVQEELLNLIKAAGLTPSATDDTQLRQAVATLIANAVASISVPAASETMAGILKLATAAVAIAGTDAATAITPATLAAAISGVARGYTRQQHPVPVERAGASGAQGVDCDLHQALAITATGTLAFAAPTSMGMGKTVVLMLYSEVAQNITWDAAYHGTIAAPLPAKTLAGKWLVLSFLCAGATMLHVGMAEEA